MFQLKEKENQSKGLNHYSSKFLFCCYNYHVQRKNDNQFNEVLLKIWHRFTYTIVIIQFTIYTISKDFASRINFTAQKVSKYRVISGSYFPVFSPNTEKCEPEITPYLNTFYAVICFHLQYLTTTSKLLFHRGKSFIIYHVPLEKFQSTSVILKI